MNNPVDTRAMFQHKGRSHKPTWNGDNRKFIANVLPFLCLSDRNRYVIRFAYGLLNEGDHSYEMESDGVTGYRDAPFLADIDIKNPAGVAHDALNRCPNHTTPNTHRWTLKETNRVLREVAPVFGYGKAEAWLMWAVVCVTKGIWWQ